MVDWQYLQFELDQAIKRVRERKRRLSLESNPHHFIRLFGIKSATKQLFTK